MRLPIDVISNTKPPRFKWHQQVETINGRSIVDSEGCLPANVENAVLSLIDLTKTLMKENEKLQEQCKGHMERIVAQSDLLSKKAEKQPPQPQKTPEKKR